MKENNLSSEFLKNRNNAIAYSRGSLLDYIAILVIINDYFFKILVLIGFSHITTNIFYAIVSTLIFFGSYMIYSLGKQRILVLDNNSLFYIYLVLFVGVPALIIGIQLGNSSSYPKWFYADTYRYLVVPIIGLLVYSGYKSLKFFKILRIYISLEVIYMLVSIFMLISGRIVRTGGNFLPYTWVFSLFYILTRKKLKKIVWLIFVLMVFYIFFSASRTFLIEVILSLLLSVFFTNRREKRYRNLINISVVVIILVLLGSQLDIINKHLYFYYERLKNSADDISILGRLYEARKAWNILISNEYYLLFGKGFGATYYLPNIFEFAGSAVYYKTNYMVHNIHIGPLSVWFRTGLLGLVGYYVLLPLKIFRKKLHLSINNIYVRSFVVWFLIKLLESFQALRIVGDATFFILITYYFSNFMDCHRSEFTKRNIN